MRFCIRFNDGLEMIMDYPCPTDKDGTEYVPLEFKTGRPDRVENVIVRSNPYRTQNSKYPLYIEVADATREGGS